MIDFDKLAKNVMAKKNSSLVEVFIHSLIIVKSWRSYYTISHTMPKEFDTEVSLDFLEHLLCNKVKGSPTTFLRNLCSEYHKKKKAENIFQDSFDEFFYSKPIVHDKLKTEDILKSFTDGFPIRCKMVLMYILMYPEDTKKIRNMVNNDLEYFILRIKSYQLRRKIMGDESQLGDLAIPSSDISKILFLSSLYNKSPLLLVLFLLFKDIGKFLQFCELFNGKTVKIPNTKELGVVFRNSLDLSSKLENNTLSVSDRDLLASISIDVDQSNETDIVKLTPLLTDFLWSQVNTISKNFDNIQNNLIKKAERTNNIDEMLKIYKAISDENVIQTKIIKDIISSVESLDDVKKLISKLEES